MISHKQIKACHWNLISALRIRSHDPHNCEIFWVKSENVKKLAMVLFLRVCPITNQLTIACQACCSLSTVSLQWLLPCFSYLASILQTAWLFNCKPWQSMTKVTTLSLTLHCPSAKYNQKYIDRRTKFRPHLSVLGPTVSCGASGGASPT